MFLFTEVIRKLNRENNLSSHAHIVKVEVLEVSQLPAMKGKALTDFIQRSVAEV
jgi:hypothetical protein